VALQAREWRVVDVRVRVVKLGEGLAQVKAGEVVVQCGAV
jgi:hypothetical protein